MLQWFWDPFLASFYDMFEETTGPRVRAPLKTLRGDLCSKFDFSRQGVIPQALGESCDVFFEELGFRSFLLECHWTPKLSLIIHKSCGNPSKIK